MSNAVTIFDLDNTLIKGDSSTLWSQFMVREGWVSDPEYLAREAQLMADYDDEIVLDVRTPEEYAEAHIPGAINVPNEEIGEEPIAELPDKDQIILVYCRSGNRSKEAAQKLADQGYTNVIEFGGIKDWHGETVAS